MKFDDCHYIEQAMGTQGPELEPMYWIVEDSLRDGKKSQAEGMLNMILYVAKYKPELMSQYLQEPYRERLKILTHELIGKKSIKKCEAITLKPPISAKKIPFKLESELQKYLVDHPGVLQEALKDPVKIMGIEVETDGDYRCDVVAESASMFYPIELKIAQGNHAVVSQCSKYCYYFYRKLRYNKFRKVQGVVIAAGFDEWSVNELRREGHWIFNMNPTSNTDITLERIH